jgi:hypothetical protein
MAKRDEMIRPGHDFARFVETDEIAVERGMPTQRPDVRHVAQEVERRPLGRGARRDDDAVRKRPTQRSEMLGLEAGIVLGHRHDELKISRARCSAITLATGA